MSTTKIIKETSKHELESQVEKFVEKGFFPRYESFRIVKDDKGNDTFYIFMDKISQASVNEMFSNKAKEHLEIQSRRKR